MYRITTYKTVGEITVWESETAPTLKELQREVKGYIEQAPDEYQSQEWFGRQHQGEIDGLWCHEEALMVDNPQPNPFFEPASWGDRLYGDVCVVEII